MKVAISTDGDAVSEHFGRCPLFTIVELQGENIINAEEIPNPGHQTGFLPRYFHEMGVNCIVAGGMGRRAIDLFTQFQIQSILGVSGKVEDVISGLINKTLKSGNSYCQPGNGKGYGIAKSDGHASQNQFL